MTHQAPPAAPLPGADPGRQVAQLREALLLVRSLAGAGTSAGAKDRMLDEAARISGAYDAALPIVQRRFDALAGETAAWVAAGVEALLATPIVPAPVAAERLAVSLEQALAELHELLA